MPTVEVYNGDLEGALEIFKRKAKAEGILKDRNANAYRGKGNRKRRDGAKKNDGNNNHS